MPRPRLALVWPAALVVLVVLVVLGWSDPATADPARPTDYRSQVRSVRPPLPAGVTVSVVGGDAFLELRVSPGHTATVPDYAQGRGQDVGTYLRFRADGVVERNDASLAARVNDRRYGSGGADPSTVGGAPRWRQVATNGRYAWHDHRIHWMLHTPPSAVDAAGRVDLGGPDGTWEVPIVVDGERHVVRGELLLLDAPSPAPWAALALMVVLAVVAATVIGHRRRRTVPHLVLALGLVLLGGAAAAVALVAWRSLPPGTGPGPTGSLVALAGTLLAGVGCAALLAGHAAAARAALAGAVAALGSWALLRRDVLSHAILPTSLPADVDRGITAVVLGAAIGMAVVLVWHPPVTERPSTRA